MLYSLIFLPPSFHFKCIHCRDISVVEHSPSKHDHYKWTTRATMHLGVALQRTFSAMTMSTEYIGENVKPFTSNSDVSI